MHEIISHKEIDELITQLRDSTDLSLAEVAFRIMWSLALLSQVEKCDHSLSADELRELADRIETPEALYLPTLFEREWRLTGWSRARHREASFQFESNRRYGFCLSVRIKLTTDETAPLNE
jgi:transcriptional regulator with XRE-family HTH domain